VANVSPRAAWLGPSRPGVARRAASDRAVAGHRVPVPQPVRGEVG